MKSISLCVRGIGHAPSMKNSKMWTGRKLITKPEIQRWMEQCIRSFESQLRSMFQTTEDGTQTEPSLRSLIASSLPQDDSGDWLIEETIKVVRVPPGQEGAEIVLERL